jgi:hypothetical protein
MYALLVVRLPTSELAGDADGGGSTGLGESGLCFAARLLPCCVLPAQWLLLRSALCGINADEWCFSLLTQNFLVCTGRWSCTRRTGREPASWWLR